jgi:hypothetical protein
MTARDAAIVGLSAVIDRRYRAGCWSQSLCYMPLDSYFAERLYAQVRPVWLRGEKRVV